MAAVSDQEEDYTANYESESDAYDSDDSSDDPTFHISQFSDLSIRGKFSKSRTKKEMQEGADSTENDLDAMEVTAPELDEKDQKQCENIQKIIKEGQLDKLKIDQCKVYLRKHGLRLAGNKDILINRIKEHIEIIDGLGEKKYPASSFVLNCKGDACKGDIVMFEQNVYEMFNIASRSASGPPCGKRAVAGRIVKESYGAAKQQHTFTIEVLWSKGDKPLPPLHPLLVKGRNLYRLKTVRQRWDNEGERQKLLSEKHARGSIARLDREARLQEKEKRKITKTMRSQVTEYLNRQQKKKTQSVQCKAAISEKMASQPHEQQKGVQQIHHMQDFQKKNECFINIPEQKVYQRQPLTCMNYRHSFVVPQQRSYVEDISNSGASRISFNQHVCEQNQNQNMNFTIPGRQFSTNPFVEQIMSYKYSSRNPNRCHDISDVGTSGYEQKQFCRYFTRGKCYYGENCKYLHVYMKNQNFAQRTKEKWPATNYY